MRYAVLQTDLKPLELELLRRAFRNVPGLTPYDANILGNDAYGVLVKNFSSEQAVALQGALRAEGVETEIVEQSHLPELPPAKLVQRLDCQPDHLLIFDPLGNNFPLEWRHIQLIAAGAVRLNDFVRYQKPRSVVRYNGSGQAVPEVEYDTVTREERNFHLLGEVVITGGALRYSFSADRFNFAGLGERKTNSPPADFCLFIQDLIRFCPQAALNQGAAALNVQQPEIFTYPTKNAFHEEIVWRLWQMRKPA